MYDEIVYVHYICVLSITTIGNKSTLYLQMKRVIEIPITNDMVPEKDECFEIEISQPTGGAVMGSITKLAVTITNDEGNHSFKK